MSATPKSFPLQKGFRGHVVGTVNANYLQRAAIEVRQGGMIIASSVMEGQGIRQPIAQVVNKRPHWSFGPFDRDTTVTVTISNSSNGGNSWTTSRMVGPLSVHKPAETDYPFQFYSNIVVSEDGANNSHDDCTVVVTEYLA